MKSQLPLTEQRIEESQRRASWLRTGPSPRRRQRQAGDCQSQKATGNLGPRDSILHQTVSRLPVANQVFLGSWKVDIHQEDRCQRSAPKRRHMTHLRWRSCCTPRKLSSWDRGGDKTYHPSGRLRSPSICLPELLRPGKGTKCRPN